MRLFHRHMWITVSAQYGRWRGSKELVTLVLRRCPCGDTDTKTLDGHWSAAELGIPEASIR